VGELKAPPDPLASLGMGPPGKGKEAGRRKGVGRDGKGVPECPNSELASLCRLDIKKFAFSNRTVDNWNSLSKNCVSYITLNNFKSNICLHWDWKPDSIV